MPCGPCANDAMEIVSFLIDFILHVDKHLETFVLNYGTWVYVPCCLPDHLCGDRRRGHAIFAG